MSYSNLEINSAGRRAVAFLRHYRDGDNREGQNAVLEEMADDPRAMTLMASHLASIASIALDGAFGREEADRQLEQTGMDYARAEADLQFPPPPAGRSWC